MLTCCLHKRRLSAVLLFFCTVLFLFLSAPVNAKESKPKPQEWQIRGIEAALGDDRVAVKLKALEHLADYESRSVELLLNRETINYEIPHLLIDTKQNPLLRVKAAVVLSNLDAKSYISEIAEMLENDGEGPYIRVIAASALSNFGNATNLDYSRGFKKV